MSKSVCMLLDERVGKIHKVILGKVQIKALELELGNSYAKEDYENLNQYRDIVIEKSDEKYEWQEIK